MAESIFPRSLIYGQKQPDLRFRMERGVPVPPVAVPFLPRRSQGDQASCDRADD